MLNDLLEQEEFKVIHVLLILVQYNSLFFLHCSFLQRPKRKPLEQFYTEDDDELIEGKSVV